MMGDELGAMTSISRALEGLDSGEQARALRWAVEKFAVDEIKVAPKVTNGKEHTLTAEDNTGPVTPVGYDLIVDLMDAAAPKTIVEHVLVASYWYQVIKKQESFGSQEVNNELKNLGHGSTNITDAYTSLMARKPPAVRQMEKSGKTKQARKRYRLTLEGIRSVERMLKGTD